MEKEETLPVWHQTIDFDALMREARKHIAALSGKLWTDHNSSDPGITQLEVLAFCIADLSYRTSFGVDDILAGYKGGKALDIDLPLAHSALPNAPVTIKDLRKVLLDMVHPMDSEKLLIRNAFPVIAEGTEVPFYAVSHPHKETTLSYSNIYLPEDIDFNPATESDYKTYENQQKIDPNGLYSIQLEFEEENEVEVFLKDLNQNYFEQEIMVGNNAYTISVLLPYWDDINWSLRNAVLTPGSLVYRKREDNNLEDYFFAVDKLNYDDYFYDYYAELELEGHLITAYIKLKTETPIQSSITIDGQTYDFKVNFLDWNELSNGVKRIYTSPNLISGPSDIEVSNVSIDGKDQLYDIKSSFKIDKNGSTKEITLLTRITFPVDTLLPNESDVKVALENAFSAIYQEKIALENEVHQAMKSVSSPMYANYLAKLNRVFSYLYDTGGVWSYISKYRNLCEDYSKFTASRVQEIALFGKLIVAPHFNVNELLAEVYFRIDQFLHPLIKFNSLNEITDKGYTFEEIFNGPLLQHGFIEDKDLENLKRRSVVYTSDLIRILMDVPGVEAVEDFNISSYIDNRLMGRNVINCLSLTNPKVYKPRLSLEKSGLEVCVNGRTEITDSETIQTWYEVKLKEIKDKQKVDGAPFHLELPLGNDMEIERYKSIQHDYPEIYGIGEFGLPAEATEQRKAEARQLKAYLLFFEQLLANYLHQIAHLPELFSFNRSIDHTYAYQPLYEVPDVAPLFQGFVQSNATWETFKQDLNNSYQTAMREGETQEEWRSRRNRFLSQMIGRFGESFAAYSTQLFDQHKAILNDPSMIGLYQQKRGEVLDRLIDDKISFAEDLEKVTGSRYQSFDTTWLPTVSLPGTWNNGNIGAYKLRLCRLLGIKIVNNQFIFGTGQNGEDLEGMHILEHILLRPRVTGNQFLGIHNRTNEEGSFVYEADLDPYSFRVTIVLPINAGRFTDPSFRAFAERLIRMETPAHILIDFKWMNAGCGKNFELHYSRWKDGLYTIKPYLFQNTERQVERQKASIAEPMNQPLKLVAKENTKIETKRGTLLIATPIETDKFETVLGLQDNLIRALNTPCKPEMKLYDHSEKILQTIDGKITFEEGVKDIFNLRFSELEGTLIVYKWDNAKNKWVEKDSFKNIGEYYLNVVDLLGKEIGLTSNYGGEGNYLLSYQVEGRIVEKLVQVTKRIVPVKIVIGNGSELLDFDMETDGTFKISRSNLRGYFLQMIPNGDGIAVISSDDLNPTPLALTKTGNKVQLSTIYKLFGAGTFTITYEQDGQHTFATLEIVEEVSIAVWNGKNELIPNEAATVIVPGEVRKVKLTFDPTGGSLNVYDPEVQLSDMNSVAFDALPIGVVLSLKAVDVLWIDRDKEVIWKDGKTYNFIYDYNGKQAAVSILFEETKVQVEAPVIKLLVNDEPQDFSTIIIPVGDNYAIHCSPDEGIRSLYKEEGAGMRLIEQVEITADNVVEEIYPDIIEELNGTGNYLISYKNESGKDTVQFSLVKRFDPVLEELSVTVFDSDTESYVEPNDGIYDLVYNYLNKDQFFEFRFSTVPGLMTLMDQEEIVFQEEVEETRGFTASELSSDDYQVSYYAKNEELNFGLNVINLDPTFTFSAVEEMDKSVYSVQTLLSNYRAKSYSWRINGTFVSRAREPQLKLDFTQNEALEIQLTVFLEEREASYSMKVYPDLILELMNG